jgi:hypothetical protein
MTYPAKVRIVNYAVPLLIFGLFAKVGYRSTRALFAESAPTTGISISSEQLQYVVGQEVSVLLSNSTTTKAYVVNNCPDEPLAVYRLENNKWVSIHIGTDASKCAGEPSDYEIPPSRSVKLSYQYWPNLFQQVGEYRIQANIEPSSEGPSTTFRIVK